MQLSKGRLLDSEKETKFGVLIRQDLEHVLVGQPAAIDYFVQLVEKSRSSLFESGRPIGSGRRSEPERELTRR